MVDPAANNDHHLIKRSIPLLILKDLAKYYRRRYAQYDIKAHPVGITSAILVCKNNDYKLTFSLFAGNLDVLLTIIKMLSVPYIKAWVDKHNILNQPLGGTANTSKYIITVDIIRGNKLAQRKIPVPMGIDLADPNSITEIRDWVTNNIDHV